MLGLYAEWTCRVAGRSAIEPAAGRAALAVAADADRFARQTVTAAARSPAPSTARTSARRPAVLAAPARYPRRANTAAGANSAAGSAITTQSSGDRSDPRHTATAATTSATTYTAMNCIATVLASRCTCDLGSTPASALVAARTADHAVQGHRCR